MANNDNKKKYKIIALMIAFISSMYSISVISPLRDADGKLSFLLLHIIFYIAEEFVCWAMDCIFTEDEDLCKKNAQILAKYPIIRYILFITLPACISFISSSTINMISPSKAIYEMCDLIGNVSNMEELRVISLFLPEFIFLGISYIHFCNAYNELKEKMNKEKTEQTISECLTKHNIINVEVTIDINKKL